MASKIPLKVVITILFMVVFAQTQKAEEMTKTIKLVGTDDNLPFTTMLPDGTKTGLYVEFWQLWSRTNNIPIDIQLTSFQDGLAAVRKGEAIHIGLFISEDRKQWADFSLPIHAVKTGVLYNRDLVANTKLSETKGLRVGAYSKSFQASFLEKNMPSIKLYYHSSVEQGIEHLLYDKTDAMVGEIPSINAQLAKRGLTGVFTLADETLIRNTVHATAAKGQLELLETINRGIENIPVKALIELEKKWLPTLKPFFSDIGKFNDLSIKDINWLQMNNAFSLGTENNWPPFEFVDKEGDFQGIAAEYVNHIENALNIEFQLSNSNSWAETFEALKRDEVDVMSGVVYSAERAKSMLFTKPYFSVPSVIVTKKDSPYIESLADLNKKKLALVKGYIIVDKISVDYPEIKIQEVNSVAEGLDMVQRGDIDAYAGTIAVIKNEMVKRNLHDLIIAAVVPYNFELSMAVRKGLEPLVGILNKVISNMDEGQKSIIANKWLAPDVQKGIDIQVVLMWVIPILTIVALIMFHIIRINSLLMSQISIREQAELERQSLEVQLHQSQKLEALGNLTGGIAHDFNNILSIIMGYSELLKNRYQDDTDLNNYIGEIYRAGTRGSKLTKKLLSYTRKQPLEETRVNVNKVLNQQHDLLQKTLTVRIKLVVNNMDNIWPIRIDSSELEDAVLNISINAMHAMADKESGAQLTITTKNVSLNVNKAKILGLSAGDYVQICIIDNGIGMSKEVKDQIFVPFYSTKADKGTGLGLSQVYGFIQRSGGAIDVMSEVNKGSQFIMYLPRLQDKDRDDENLIIDNPLPGGSESILVVDDEVALGDLASEVLSQQGYQTFQAENAEQALAILEKNHVDLLLTDVIMPRISGHQLSAMVHERYPHIKIQLVSGYTKNNDLEANKSHLFKNLLHKPYSEQKLLRKVRDTLDR